MCGGSAPAPAVTPPTPPPPPPQLAKTPDATAVRAQTAATNQQQYGSTILTSGMGDKQKLDDKLGKKTLLGQ